MVRRAVRVKVEAEAAWGALAVRSMGAPIGRRKAAMMASIFCCTRRPSQTKRPAPLRRPAGTPTRWRRPESLADRDYYEILNVLSLFIPFGLLNAALLFLGVYLIVLGTLMTIFVEMAEEGR